MKKYYKLEVMVEASEFSHNDTHLIITKVNPKNPKEIATFYLPNPEAEFVANNYRNHTHYGSYNTNGWVIDECEDFPLWNK